MDVNGTTDATPGRETLSSAREEVRIVVQGSLSADVLVELEGFGVRAAEPGLLLFGEAVDEAALVGTLRRLHAAGLQITAVECRRRSLDPRAPIHTHMKAPAFDAGSMAEVEVDGTPPAAVADLLDCVRRRDNPATTTLEFLVADNDELFSVLDALEQWGLHLRALVTGV